jgi:hypothetical protein
VPKFAAEVEFRFESTSLETAGAALRRLREVAETAGFQLKRAKVAPDEEDTSRGTAYGPLTNAADD